MRDRGSYQNEASHPVRREPRRRRSRDARLMRWRNDLQPARDGRGAGGRGLRDRRSLAWVTQS